MFVKNLSLCLCIINFFIFDQADGGLREDLSKKKYEFSEPVLDEQAAFLQILGKAQTNEIAAKAFLLMWADAEQGNEKVQEKLLTLFSTVPLYNNVKTRLPLLNDISKYSLEALIDIGIKQEKAWAFYEKALKESDSNEKFILLNQALNNIDKQTNKQRYQIYYKERQKLINSKKIKTSKFNPKEKNKKNIKDYVNGIKLFQNGEDLFNVKYESDCNNNLLLNECLDASCDLGHMLAYVGRGNEYYAKNDLKGAFKWYLKAAEKGHVVSMFNVGNILINESRYLNKLEGLNWLLKAAEEGDIDAMHLAGVILKELSDVPAYKEKVFYLFKVAAENDHLEAMIALGDMFLNGFYNNNINLDEAAKWFLKAAQTGDPEKMYIYGIMLKNGTLGISNSVEGNAWVRKAADEGYIAAMNHCGGEELESLNRVESYKWFLKAATKGDWTSMYNLASILYSGVDGIERNLPAARKWLEKVADKGSDEAMILLASLYLFEYYNNNIKIKLKNDYKEKAFVILESLFNKGYFNNFLDFDIILESKNKKDKLYIEHSKIIKKNRFYFITSEDNKIDSMYQLARLYTFKNKYTEAFKLFLAAAKSNHVRSMHIVGLIYEFGFGNDLKPDYEKAFEWYKCAAEKNDADSMVSLAQLLIVSPENKKNEQNIKDALFWLQKADSMGKRKARQYLDICQDLLKENEKSVIIDDALVGLIDKKNELNLDAEKFNQLKIQEQQSQEIVVDHQENEQEIKINFDENYFDAIEEIGQNIIDNIFVQDIKNPKYIRENLRKVGELIKKQKNLENKEHVRTLDENNQKIINILLDQKTKNKKIDYAQLVNLFKDPFFENQVDIKKTKSGCVITAKNYRTLEFVIASTHKKHGQSYDGLNREFAKDLIKILKLFNV